MKNGQPGQSIFRLCAKKKWNLLLQRCGGKKNETIKVYHLALRRTPIGSSINPTKGKASGNAKPCSVPPKPGSQKG